MYLDAAGQQIANLLKSLYCEEAQYIQRKFSDDDKWPVTSAFIRLMISIQSYIPKLAQLSSSNKSEESWSIRADALSQFETLGTIERNILLTHLFSPLPWGETSLE
ncbi:MAG: hypothetical protein ACK4PR_08940, partial [Gammaproteobacteria bacterium]